MCSEGFTVPPALAAGSGRLPGRADVLSLRNSQRVQAISANGSRDPSDAAATSCSIIDPPLDYLPTEPNPPMTKVSRAGCQDFCWSSQDPPEGARPLNPMPRSHYGRAPKRRTT